MVSNKLKSIRTNRGMSISELARRTALSRMTITNIENGKTLPNLQTTFKIAEALEKDVEDIFFTSGVNRESHLEGVN